MCMTGVIAKVEIPKMNNAPALTKSWTIKGDERGFISAGKDYRDYALVLAAFEIAARDLSPQQRRNLTQKGKEHLITEGKK